MKASKRDFLKLMDTAISFNQGVIVGIQDKKDGEVKVVNVNVRFDRVKGYKGSFDAIYGEDLVNKVFPVLSAFAIKLDDGIPFTEADLKPKSIVSDKKVSVIDKSAKDNKKSDKGEI